MRTIFVFGAAVLSLACGSRGAGSRAAGVEAPIGSAPASAAPAAPSAAREKAPGGSIVLAALGVGLVAIEGGEARTLFATTESNVGLGVTRDGSIFASYYEVGTIRVQGGVVSRLGPTRFVAFAGRAFDDVWGVTDDIEWSVAHHDGKGWSTSRARKDFGGVYSDDKFEGLAVDAGGAVWLASDNGVFRRAGFAWARVDPPSGAASAQEIFAMGSTIVARFPSGTFLRAGDGWSEVAWPADTTLAAGDGESLFTGRTNGDAVVIGSPGGATTRFDPHAFPMEMAVDGAGRVWIASDAGLAVTDDRGRAIASYGPGQLAGVRGRIERMVAVGSGPKGLPAPAKARRVRITGRAEIYRSRKALANATVSLCLVRGADGGCDAPPNRKTTTSVDGAFVFDDVPEGEYDVLPEPPRASDDCQSPFTASHGRHASLARDCPDTSCDLGTLFVCMPFEMPPPPR